MMNKEELGEGEEHGEEKVLPENTAKNEQKDEKVINKVEVGEHQG